jgi:hypothetical protein
MRDAPGLPSAKELAALPHEEVAARLLPTGESNAGNPQSNKPLTVMASGWPPQVTRTAGQAGGELAGQLRGLGRGREAGDTQQVHMPRVVLDDERL